MGGLVGRNLNGGTIENCYATGAVSGTSDVGGLVGDNFSALVLSQIATLILGLLVR